LGNRRATTGPMRSTSRQNNAVRGHRATKQEARCTEQHGQLVRYGIHFEQYLLLGGSTTVPAPVVTRDAVAGTRRNQVPAFDSVVQRVFFVARLRGGVNRSAIAAIADGTRR
jgi:hypothetical protein